MPQAAGRAAVSLVAGLALAAALGRGHLRVSSLAEIPLKSGRF